MYFFTGICLVDAIVDVHGKLYSLETHLKTCLNLQYSGGWGDNSWTKLESIQFCQIPKKDVFLPKLFLPYSFFNKNTLTIKCVAFAQLITTFKTFYIILIRFALKWFTKSFHSWVLSSMWKSPQSSLFLLGFSWVHVQNLLYIELTSVSFD